MNEQLFAIFGPSGFVGTAIVITWPKSKDGFLNLIEVVEGAEVASRGKSYEARFSHDLDNGIIVEEMLKKVIANYEDDNGPVYHYDPLDVTPDSKLNPMP